MNIRAQFYTDLAAVLQTVSGVKHIDLYNNQLAHLKEEETFGFPAVFIEFGSMQWLDRIQNVQTADVDITLHIVSNSAIKTSLKSGMAPLGLAHLELIDTIHNMLQGLSGNYFTPLRRNRSEQDHDHDYLWSHTETYHTRFTDTAIMPQMVNVSAVGLDLVKGE